MSHFLFFKIKLHFDSAGAREIGCYGNPKRGPVDREEGKMGIWEMRFFLVLNWAESPNVVDVLI
jgi:hypothetical protein